MPNVAPVFQELRKILSSYSTTLVVVHDDDTQLYLNTGHIPANRKPMFFGAVQIKKAYVSFHLMPVYVRPELLKLASPQLKARMQGKSCFNFKTIDPGLFAELAKLTESGYASYKEQGLV